MLEIEVDGKNSMIHQSAVSQKLDSKEALKKMIRVFNNFSFIKNVFEIDSDDFSLEYKCFTLKDSLIYWMNFLMTSYPDSNINLTLDPCLPRDVDCDIVKFHQIMITLVDFALKNSKSVEINSEAIYVDKLGGYEVEFIISFVSNIAFAENDLEKMFILQDDSFFQNLSTYKSIGLALNLTARLLKVINGSFNKIQRNEDGTTVLKFKIPFRMADFSNNPYIHVPTLHALMEWSIDQSSCDRLVQTSDKWVQNVSMNFEQESGNEWSNDFQSHEVLKKIDNIKESLIKQIGSDGTSKISNTGVFVRSKSHFEENKGKKYLAKTHDKQTIEKMSPELRLRGQAVKQDMGGDKNANELFENFNVEVNNKPNIELSKLKKEESKNDEKIWDSGNSRTEKREKVVETISKLIKGQPIGELEFEKKTFSNKSSKANMIRKDSSIGKDLQSVLNYNFDEKEIDDKWNKTLNIDISIKNTNSRNTKDQSSQNEEGISHKKIQSKVRKTLMETITEGIKISHQVIGSKLKTASFKVEETKEIAKGKSNY